VKSTGRGINAAYGRERAKPDHDAYSADSEHGGTKALEQCKGQAYSANGSESFWDFRQILSQLVILPDAEMHLSMRCSARIRVAHGVMGAPILARQQTSRGLGMTGIRCAHLNVPWAVNEAGEILVFKESTLPVTFPAGGHSLGAWHGSCGDWP
jgi:hypothetical protein